MHNCTSTKKPSDTQQVFVLLTLTKCFYVINSCVSSRSRRFLTLTNCHTSWHIPTGTLTLLRRLINVATWRRIVVANWFRMQIEMTSLWRRLNDVAMATSKWRCYGDVESTLQSQRLINAGTWRRIVVANWFRMQIEMTSLWRRRVYVVDLYMHNTRTQVRPQRQSTCPLGGY